jgi:hypothetical protein
MPLNAFQKLALASRTKAPLEDAGRAMKGANGEEVGRMFMQAVLRHLAPPTVALYLRDATPGLLEALARIDPKDRQELLRIKGEELIEMAGEVLQEIINARGEKKCN